MSNILFIGYRPQEMGGFQGNALQDNIKSKIDQVISSLKSTDTIYTGLSLGIDQWVAESAIKYKIPYIVYLAYEGQENRWFSTTRNLYKQLLKGSKEIIYHNRGTFDVKKLIARDQKLVDLADIIYSFYHGKHINLKYAEKMKKDIRDIMPIGQDDDYFITI
jgi:uncharacterized phage-like protein YoqJ